jgi:hypothetical protein
LPQNEEKRHRVLKKTRSLRAEMSVEKGNRKKEDK